MSFLQSPDASLRISRTFNVVGPEFWKAIDLENHLFTLFLYVKLIVDPIPDLKSSLDNNIIFKDHKPLEQTSKAFLEVTEARCMCVLLAYLRAEISCMNFDVKAQCHKHVSLLLSGLRMILCLKRHFLHVLHVLTTST